ncbi:protein asteroid homolog 1-like [Myxocyprinus asiaticus]|uniref:protein asteroid homolog 1-like n=1 Tax=Myxocyprinus asiaticus TaxID=70543 RepID=UPI002221AA32|nr:protein asteroid homolog 1-like [Myxocyprinus asiaticus]XP_051526422.1 protein asteroid homolog 1-like [Myxocyprinus asiaticus]
MGVRGLTSYVEGNHQFFTDMRFRDCRLVIDGCSLYFRLYFNSGLDQARGGDYDKFAVLVQQFFAALSECNVKPFVVLDGGMDQTDKKFKTLQERTQSKIREAHALSRGSPGSVLPLLTREVFLQVLSELGVPLVQCISEADFEIASLAKHWGCPVLTNDSDFYIFDLHGGYLPYSFFQWNNVSGKATERYIPAQLFTVNRFCSHFNHMNKQLLPLFAVVTGNDYTPAKITEIFFRRVELERVPVGRKSGCSCNPRIESFLLWLAQFTSPVDALEEVLDILGGQQKEKFHTQLSAGIQDYQLPRTSILAQYFSSAQPALPNTQDLPAALISQPEWLLRAFASGKLPSLVLNVLVLQKVLLIAQVENTHQPSSHITSLSIRKTIYSLLLLEKVRHDSQRQQNVTQRGRGRGRGREDLNRQSQGMGGQQCDNLCVVDEYDRQDLNLKKNTVEAQLPNSVHQLNLATVDKVPAQVRLQVLLGTLGMMDHLLQPLPPHLRLPVCVTIFWKNNSKPKPSHPRLQAMLLGLVYGELSWRTAYPDDPLYCSKSAASVCQRLSQLRVNPGQKWDLELGVAHSFSQWQSCMLAGLYLNQLLCFPLPEPRYAWVFSGTLLHGLEAAIRGGHQPESLLAGDTGAWQLYSILLKALTGPAVSATPRMSRGGGQIQAQQRGRGNAGRGPGNEGRGRASGGRGMGHGGKGRGNRSRGMMPADSDLDNRFSLLTFEWT